MTGVKHIGIGGVRFDHIVALVTDLRGEMDRWTRAGFTVVYGGVHAGGESENALIALHHGDYLELLAPRGGAEGAAGSAISQRFAEHLRGEESLTGYEREVVTPRDERVPSSSGAVATLRRLRIAVEDLTVVAAAYEALTGPAVRSGSEVAVFRIGGVSVEICRTCEGGLGPGPVSAGFEVASNVDAEHLPSWFEVLEPGGPA